MKKIKSKLFEDLKLKNSEIVTIVGGSRTYTVNGEDTDPVGGGYDKLYNTCQDGTTSIDSTQTDITDKTTVDKPLQPKINIISQQ